MTKLTDAQRSFIRDNAYYAVVTTLRADGSPHSTVVWVDEEDGNILFNTTLHRAKWRELDADPRVSVVVLDAQDGYRWLERTFDLHLMSQYFITYLPAQVRVVDLLTVAAIALLLSLASTVYPAFRAARLKPADVLKHE